MLRGAWILVAIILASAAAGCVTDQSMPLLQTHDGVLGATTPVPTQPDDRTETYYTGSTDNRTGHTELAVPPSAPGAASQISVSDDGKKVSLNFVDADLQSFVRAVFDEVLGETAVVDATLTGRVSVNTVEPVSKATAIEMVRASLQMNGATLTQNKGVYQVSKTGDRSHGAPGGTVRIIQLRNINADLARNALQSFISQGTQISALQNGRVLVLSGTPGNLDNLEQVLASFDIDQMKGVSFSLIPLHEARAVAVSSELTAMYGEEKGLRILPIDRMNAIMLISQSPEAIGRAKLWVSRLDQTGYDGRRVYVYPVQNRRANELAEVLSQMLNTQGGVSTSVEASVGPSGSAASTVPKVDVAFAAASNPSGGGASGAGALAKEGVAISADTSTNSLVVIAKPEDYRIIEMAIRRLDVQPSQVLIEATIAEVKLNKSLKNGVRWYLENGDHKLGLTDSPVGTTGPAFPGFNYIFSATKAKLVVSALSSVTDVEIISSPALTVLDNQTATLKVGDQVPIATRSARSVTDPDSPIVNDIELKDTGIILSVTPRVNASGLVQLDISQEASDVVPTTTSAIDSPTIRQRKINSSVAVNSGTEIILGGLITNRRERSRQGFPVLKDIPVLGEAFSTNRVHDRGRTELLIIIRPVVMARQADVVAITQEIKSRLRGMPMEPPVLITK